MHWQTTKAYLDTVASTDQQDNSNRFKLDHATTEDAYTYVVVALQMTDCLRLLLLALAMRKNNLSKLFIYLHTFWFVLSTLLP